MLNHLKKTALLLLTAFGCCHSYCQLSLMPKEVKEYIVQGCAICSRNPPDSVQVFTSKEEYSKTDTYYHNCHVFFEKGMVDSAHKCALFALAALGYNYSNDRCTAMTLIEAKILYNRNFLKQSLHEYFKLLKCQSIQGKARGYLYTNIGCIYVGLEDYPSSLLYLTEAIDKYNVSDLKTLQITYNDIGICYLDMKQMKKAEAYFIKSTDIARSLKDTVGLAYLYTNIANQYYEQYLDKPAIKYFATALQYAKLTRDFLIKQIAYRNMATVFENKKNYKSALMFRKLYEDQHDSIYNRDNVWGTAEEKNKLDSQLHSREVQVAQQKNKLQGLELDRQREHFYIALFTSIIFLSFFAFAFYAYRQKNKQNIIISAQREELDALNHTKDQLFSVVAHDLRSPVQTLKVTLLKLRTALRDKNISRAEQVSGEIESISNNTYSLLNNLLYWALSQTGQLHFAQDKLNIRRLVEQVLYDYAAVAAVKDIRLENNVTEDLHSRGDMNTVKIILRNLVDNAIKFSPSFTPVVVSGHAENGKCIVLVVNEGKGIDESIIEALANKNIKRIDSGIAQGQSTGIGLWLVKTMAERNGGSLQIERSLEGTKMNIHLPQYRNHEQTQNTDS